MHITNPFSNVIDIYYRDGDRRRKTKRIQNYFPYFYVKDEDTIPEGIGIKSVESNFTSIFNDKLKKIIVSTPFQVRELRQFFPKSFEADIPFIDRFLIDNLDVKSLDSTIQYMIIDIEVDSINEFPKPEEAKFPIISIGIYDSFEKKHYVICWRDDLKQSIENKEDFTILKFSAEKDMINSFMRFIDFYDPDIIIGWNVINFDGRYIINRMKNLGIDFLKLSPVNKVRLDDKFKKVFINIQGRTIIDLMEIYQKYIQYIGTWNLFGIESYSLDNIAKIELGLEKSTHENPGKLWRENIDELIYYNYYDVSLTQKIEEKLGFLDLLNNLRLYTNCSWDHVATAGKYVDMLLLTYCKKQNIVLPSSERNLIEEDYKGGLVDEPTPGLHRNVANLDLKSMYPSIIMNFNISPECIVDKESEDSIKIDDVVFSMSKKGILPTMIEQVYTKRVELKKEMKDAFKKHGSESKEWKVLNIRQTMMKIIANSSYGVFGYKKFRLYDVRVAKSITGMGRKIIDHCKKIAKDNGYDVIYRDTDSCEVKMDPNYTNDELKAKSFELAETINKSFSDFCSSINKNLKNDYLEIELDKIYESILFVESKKKYVGMVVFSSNKDMREMQLVGFELKRRSTPVFAKRILKHAYEMILNFKSEDEVSEYIRQQYGELKKSADYKEFGITIRMGKDVDEYSTNVQHIRGAEYSKKYLKYDFYRMDYLKIFFIKSTPKGFPPTDIISLGADDKFPDSFVIDYDRTFNRIIVMSLQRIYDALGWNVEKLRGQTSLSAWLTNINTNI